MEYNSRTLFLSKIGTPKLKIRTSPGEFLKYSSQTLFLSKIGCFYQIMWFSSARIRTHPKKGWFNHKGVKNVHTIGIWMTKFWQDSFEILEEKFIIDLVQHTPSWIWSIDPNYGTFCQYFGWYGSYFTAVFVAFI